MTETWKPIAGYEGIYEVSDLGRVKRVAPSKHSYPGKILAGGLDQDGYRILLLYKLDGKRRMFKEHRLVAQAFIPNPDNFPQVNHKNTVKTDNRVENLEWCSSKHNINHAVDNGLWNPSKGESHHQSKLDERAVQEIRQLLSEGTSHSAIARMFGVQHSTIGDIHRGLTWKHVQ